MFHWTSSKGCKQRWISPHAVEHTHLRSDSKEIAGVMNKGRNGALPANNVNNSSSIFEYSSRNYCTIFLWCCNYQWQKGTINRSLKHGVTCKQQLVCKYATGGKQNRQRMYNRKYQLADGLHIAACPHRSFRGSWDSLSHFTTFHRLVSEWGLNIYSSFYFTVARGINGRPLNWLYRGCFFSSEKLNVTRGLLKGDETRRRIHQKDPVHPMPYRTDSSYCERKW